MTFKPGDIVQLKSGGSKMTVESANENAVICVWSDGKKTYRESFLPATLVASESIEKMLEELKKQQINIKFVAPKNAE
ncbi:MAG TPA: DUF2158 domain-containing protein [Rhizomicrobium sp.]|nr:DUF2158 domain-containing protein [Rhizomicrobium sp.]